MRNRRILAVLTTVIAAAVMASLLIPAATGASPKAKASSVLCTATGTKPVGNTGAIAVSVKGTGSGSSGLAGARCFGKLTGKWAKNSTTFSTHGVAKAVIGTGSTVKLTGTPALDAFLLRPKLAGTLTGTGLSAGASLTIDINCQFSYPPLKIRCTIIISD